MKRHRFDIFSFVSGLVFAGLGAAYLINDGSWRFDAGPWVWPVILVLGGAVVLLSTIRDERDLRTATESAGSVEIAPTGVDEIDDIEPTDPVL